MDDLYNLFYNEKTPELPSRCDDPGGLRKKELRLCHLVVETFQNTKLPESVSATGLQTRLPSAVNFHEFLRTFLAVKILSETLERVDIFASPGQESVPRISIYKVYYILCQKLISKYPNVSDSLSLQQNIILGHSKLGKLLRLVFPDLPMKRLGRRGESRPHYLGIKWNEAIVGEEILRLIDLEVPAIQDTFNDSRKYRNTLVQRRKLRSCTKEIREQKQHHTEKESRSKDEQKPKSAVESHSAYQKPVYSFVTFSCKYPSFDCSPRVWKSMRNSTSQQSKWAKDTMNHSSSFLKRHHVDLDPLIENFHRGIYSDNSASGLSNTMVGALKTLVASSACTEAYMHLYLAILLLVFPVILASDQDVTVTLKAQLQESIQNCIAKMDGESSSLAKVDKDNLKTYTGVLGKMIRLSEMTNTKVRGISPEHVLEEISKDVTDAGRSSLGIKSTPLSLDGRYLRVAILAFNAYGFDINEGNRGERKSTTDAAMLAISRKFTHATKAFSEKIQDIPIWAKFNGLTGVAPTIPHQMFTIGVEIFHVTSLMDATVAKLPIPMLNMMLAQILNEVQTSSFEEFRNRDSGLSTEVFKSWWVFSIMFQEYLGIMGEVVALSQRLK
ncbi:hypothetical protein JCM33374_g4091 [Metschnikowia sp. JCM 33374]|nr:hypothetical protein JCM33374_g4091 [Metschnikowia sp. JCM 33374]